MIQNVADRLGLPKPSTVIGNDDPTVQTLLALANQEGDLAEQQYNIDLGDNDEIVLGDDENGHVTTKGPDDVVVDDKDVDDNQSEVVERDSFLEQGMRSDDKLGAPAGYRIERLTPSDRLLAATQSVSIVRENCGPLLVIAPEQLIQLLKQII